MATMSDSERYEKTIVFGGITHSKVGQAQMGRALPPSQISSKKGGLQDGSKNKTMFSDKSELLEEGQESSHLSNDLYALEIRQIM